MSPQDLAEYIKVLRESNITSAHLILSNHNITYAEHINIVFNPEPNINIGETIKPGGWKSPTNLDSDKLFDAPEHEV